MNTKTLLAAGLALACTLSAQVFAADAIKFDANGDGVEILDIGALDWSVGSTLNVDAVLPGGVTTFESYSHAALAATIDTNGTSITPTGLNTLFEVTFITGFTNLITNTVIDPTTCNAGVCQFKQTITLEEAPVQTVNFFEVYYDDLTDLSGLQSNALTGLGYGDGQLILSGSLFDVSGNFTATVSFNDLDNSGTFSAGDTLITSLLDQFIVDNWGGQQTISGEGATSLQATVTFQDTNFFITGLATFLQEMFFNTSNVIPFDESNPSNSYDNGAGGTFNTGDGSVDIGQFNGLSGPDILLQTDSNNSFTTVTEVPEPSTVLLFALGLLFLGFGSRNHYARKN
uniref:PEP-CTERM sorting domain-containing protein n=1 Tax=Marinobacterium profundum TaxID=1714300 RepID=UPI000835B7F6|nr:PEP-CTERM sorting domain-containing protein [Marinobacterium profundum]